MKSNKGEGKVTEEEGFLNDTEKRTLLKVARSAVNTAVRGTPRNEPEPTENLRKEFGVFVTLHRYGDLRGCLGRFEADHTPLIDLVRIMAQESAMSDVRFRPVSSDELNELDIEISVLTPMRRVDSPEDVQVGKHGLYIVGSSPMGGKRHGTLLPQVPVEQGWDRVTFLEHTSRKAGLPPDAWKKPETELYVYEAQVFGEKELGLWSPEKT